MKWGYGMVPEQSIRAAVLSTRQQEELMKRSLLTAAIGCASLVIIPLSGAAAQSGWMPGQEITGHAVQVDTNGVMNTVYFDQGGGARIVTASGREVPARWSVQGQNLCLQTSAGQECWNYQSRFQTGQPVTLTSSCNSTSRWTALSTQPAYMPPPVSSSSGERG